MNTLGLIISFVFLFLIIFLSYFISKTSNELSRKFVHIGVSNWWLILTLFFDNVIYAAIVPMSFVIINYISYKKRIFKSIERETKGLGTVYYALSCLILTLLSFLYYKNFLYGGIGMLVMGYGDGFAAIIGTKHKSKKHEIFKDTKTIAGTLAMFTVTLFVTSIFTLSLNNFNLVSVFTISFFGTLIEVITPQGLDNLTVPLLTTLIASLLL